MTDIAHQCLDAANYDYEVDFWCELEKGHDSPHLYTEETDKIKLRAEWPNVAP